MDTAYNENKHGSLRVTETTYLYLGHSGHRAHQCAEVFLLVQVRVHATFREEGNIPVAQVVADGDAHYNGSREELVAGGKYVLRVEIVYICAS